MIHGSPRQTPRARRHDANLARILDKAMRLVAEGGLEALSMARLAEAADYTPGALYRYFRSKDALLARLVEGILGEAREALLGAQARLPAQASPLTRVFALVAGYRAFAKQRPHGFGLLAVTMAEPRILLTKAADAAPVTRAALKALEPLAEALGAAEAAGQVSRGDVAERTVCLFAALQGLLQLSKRAPVAPGILELDRLVPGATRALLIGWGAKPRAVDAALARTHSLALDSLGGVQ